jgi:signal transduction histidine kinase
VVVRSEELPAAVDQWPAHDLPPEGEHLVLIVVEDDGPGIDPALREKVLQRGVRADEAAPGSGLGLAIVRELAELYGGSIALTAASSGGLCARLILPAASRQ